MMETLQLPLILMGVYIVVMPILFRLVPVLHTKLVINRKLEKMNGPDRARYKPEYLWPKWKERIAYTIKDKRDFSLGSSKKKKSGEPQSSKIQNRQFFFLLWLIGLIAVGVGAFLMNFYVMGAGYLIFFFVMGFGIAASKDMIEAQKALMKRMFEIANAKLGVSLEHADNPGAVIKVLEWSEPLKPQRVQFTVPTTFGEEGAEGFLRLFNQVFGTETTWVPFDDPETGRPGWDFEQGLATFYAVPPLPQMAPWHERYVLSEGIAWSFFPIALGVENGVEMLNPESGEMENVLGFDLSGLQAKEGKKAGLKVGGEITTSPMCLTGDTLVLTQEGNLSLQEIASSSNPIMVKSMNSKFEFVWSKMHGTKMTRVNSKIINLTFDDGSTVKCTPDHEWLLSYGTYVEAKDLLNLYVKGFDQEDRKVVEINDAGFADVYDGEVENTHNFVVVPDENTQKGLVTSNCFIGGGTGGGKSLATNTLVEVLDGTVQE